VSIGEVNRHRRRRAIRVLEFSDHACVVEVDTLRNARFEELLADAVPPSSPDEGDASSPGSSVLSS
jgi:hypothetical protein